MVVSLHTIARLHRPQRIRYPLRSSDSGLLDDYELCIARLVKDEPHVRAATTWWGRGQYARELARHRVYGALELNGLQAYCSQEEHLLAGIHVDAQRNLEGFLGFIAAMNKNLGGRWVLSYTMMPEYHRMRVKSMRATETASGN